MLRLPAGWGCSGAKGCPLAGRLHGRPQMLGSQVGGPSIERNGFDPLNQNPPNRTGPAARGRQPGAQPDAPGLGPDDVFYTLFRHKWMILAFACLGIVGAVVVRLVVPITYSSRAKLLVRYVVDQREVNPANANQIIKSPSMGGETILNSELEILKSLDVAIPVATNFTAERILAKLGGGTNIMRAAGEIRARISVEVPKRTDVIVVTFEHPDRELVQPILAKVIECYQEKHRQVRLGTDQDEVYERQLKQIREKLSETTQALNRRMTQANIVSLEDAKKSYESQFRKVSDDLFNAQTELAERKAVLGDWAATPSVTSGTNASRVIVPPEIVEEYGDLVVRLDEAKKKKRQLLSKNYLESHPEVTAAIATITVIEGKKAKLEEAHKGLLESGVVAGASVTNTLGVDVAAEMAALRRAVARVTALSEQLSNLQVKAFGMMAAEPEIAELLRQRDLDEAYLRFTMSGLEQRRMSEAADSGKIPSMGDVQKPTPPLPESGKRMKLVAAAFGGCLGLGLMIAFLIDFLLDQTVRRSVDVERHLHLPLLLAIPHTFWRPRLRLPWKREDSVMRVKHAATLNGHSPTPHSESGLANWNPGNHLQIYAEGLRERLITYFEINNLSHIKPKRVAVTSCSGGAGVTAIATSLASALSRAGDAKVLLVDMNVGQGVAQTFCNGSPSDGQGTPQPESHSPSSDGLSVMPQRAEENGRPAKPLPTSLTHLAPQFEANDHDFIIFDLPPVSQTSITPRLSGYMDLVLLILESEKTGRQVASRASALMRESRANVAAVLNKCRQHVPAKLSQEL